jgi:hypothetical protein
MKAQQTIKDPKGLDRALMALRTSIASTCDWLDNVYGEAEALAMGEGFIYPPPFFSCLRRTKRVHPMYARSPRRFVHLLLR